MVAAVATSTMSRPPPLGPEVAAFSPGSFWNVALSPDAPVASDSEEQIEFLRHDNVRAGCIQLVGSRGNEWGTPIFFAGLDSPEFSVTSDRYPLPDEFRSLRIPPEAQAAANSDSEMIVYDLDRGYVAHLSKAEFSDGRWTATGGSVAYLDSDGLDSRLPGAEEPRNIGSFRGYNGLVATVRYDEVARGSVDHVMKVAVNSSLDEAVFPMVGSDGESNHPHAPPQGARLRIKPDIDLATFELHPQAQVIAEALQRYGAIIADSSGGPIALKLEDTRLGGRGNLWDIEPDALCEIPIDAFEVIEHGYDPTREDG